MTPEEELAILRKYSAEIDAAVENAFNDLMRRIRAGEAPRDAMQAVFDAFTGEYAAIYAAGLSAVIAESVGSASALTAEVGPITLSQRLYAQAEATSANVQGIVQRHARGFQNARDLAREIYEGYGFRADEPIKIAKSNPELPRYMREALMDGPDVARQMKRTFARIQVNDLSTPELRTAYRQVLDELDLIESGAGSKHLEQKLRVAFYERTRYYAKRIAETELHREFAQRQARELMLDEGVDYVQWRMSPMHPVADICDYFAGLNRYGLGPGVYPKAEAPVAPAHPFCKCVLSPLTGLIDAEPTIDDDADLKLFDGFSRDTQRRIAGSNAKLERVKAGESAWDVHNSNIEPDYQVRPVKSF